MRMLWSQGRALLASSRDAEAFERLRADIGALLERQRISVRMGQGDTPSGELDRVDPTLRGQHVLQLYFAQLGHLDRAALDLRPSRFSAVRADDDEATLIWEPRQLSVAWDGAFLDGVRGLYTGFYRDDPALFARSADALGLSVAADLFRKQFGEGDQTAVRFELDRFKQSFHEIFVRCKTRGVTLQPNFVALGIYLGGLYEHLDSLGVPLNVRRAFEAVWPADTQGRLH